MKSNVKKKKWFILLFILILLLFIGGGILIWVNQISHRNVTEEEIGMQDGFFNFDSILSEMPRIDSSQKNDKDLSLPPDSRSSEQNAPHTEASPQPAVQESKPDSGYASQEKTGDPSLSSKQESRPPNGTVTEEAIYHRYYPAFERLESLAVMRIDQLLAAAKKEYQSKKDQPGFSKMDFASRYMSAANKLQGEVDKVFYKLLDQMRAELNENHFSLSLVDQAEKTYHEKIASKKDAIIAESLSFNTLR